MTGRQSWGSNALLGLGVASIWSFVMLTWGWHAVILAVGISSIVIGEALHREASSEHPPESDPRKP